MQKNNVLHFSERKNFPSFSTKLTPSAAVVFVAQCLALFLFASVEGFGYALALGLFCGLVYARQNILALSPAFIIACVVFDLSWWTVLYTVTPIILLIVLYAVFFRLKRNVPSYAVALTALVSMTPYVVCACVFDAAYSLVAVSAVLAAVTSFAASGVAYALFIRRQPRLTLDEKICGGIMFAVSAYALYGVNAYGFGLYFTVLGFVVLFASDCLNSPSALFASALMGAGASLACGDVSLLAASVVWGAAAVIFSPFTRFASAIGILALDALMFLTSAYTGSGWQTLVMGAAGMIVYLFVPKHVRLGVRDAVRKKGNKAYSSIINRRGGELASKLYSVGDVFYDMSENLDQSVNAEDIYNPKRLSEEIASSYCGKCADRESCYTALGGSTAPVLEPMAQAAMNRGKVTILDMPPFITGRCNKMHSLAAVMNSAADGYNKRREQAGGVQLGKRLMSEQFAGIALVMESLAKECAKQIDFSDDRAEVAAAELLKHNIVASEVVISGSGTDTSAALTVRECDAEKAVIPRIMSSVLKTKLNCTEIVNRGEQRIVHLEGAPVFEIAYGVAERQRGGEDVSGDSKCISNPSRHRRLFAISDGMGSGTEAARASRNAVNMIENFYRAGFDNALILSLVNKLLKLSAEDCFSSIDLSVIDTVSGGLDVIKLGSAASFIVRRENIEVLQSAAPPAGILDSVQPLTLRSQLYDGDMLIMMSDGVYDALDNKGVCDTVDALSTSNPQILADALLDGALENGAEDDCTVLALRLFCM